MIALGLGAQERSVENCIELFRNICNQGFEAKPLTKLQWGFGFFARWFTRSMYKTGVFETTLQDAFATATGQPNTLFGLENSCRVAVTTTVKTPMGEESQLIANYRYGGTGDQDRYISSDLPLWKA